MRKNLLIILCMISALLIGCAKSETVTEVSETLASESIVETSSPETTPTECPHDFVEFSRTDTTCLKQGHVEYSCTWCGETKTEQGESAPGHSFTDGICTVCGSLEGSKGLLFAENDGAYTVFSIGTCVDENIVIPDFYEGLPVTAIGAEAFADSQICSVVIPETVTYIDNAAFRGCKNLNPVVIPDSVTHIGNFAFGDCRSLEDLTIGSGVVTIGWHAFSDCRSLESVVIPDSVEEMMHAVFFHCPKLKEVTLGANIRTMGAEIFAYSKIEHLTIPASVTEIGSHLFYCSDTLQTLTFEDPHGWQLKSSAGTVAIDVSDPVANAKGIIDAYEGYTWIK